MSSTDNKLDRLEAWFDYQNARHDALSRRRPSWWHAGKVMFGALFVGKSAVLAMAATGFGGYALAFLFLIAGISLAFEGGKMLLERWLGWQM